MRDAIKVGFPAILPFEKTDGWDVAAWLLGRDGSQVLASAEGMGTVRRG
jgi:hypothetical protein